MRRLRKAAAKGAALRKAPDQAPAPDTSDDDDDENDENGGAVRHCRSAGAAQRLSALHGAAAAARARTAQLPGSRRWGGALQPLRSRSPDDDFADPAPPAAFRKLFAGARMRSCQPQIVM
jgi:hypothetical protein